MNAPKLPTENSLEGVALAEMANGKRISHLSFQRTTNSYCLRAAVYNLRTAGFPIEECWNAGGVSRFSGRRTKFKKYFISNKNLQVLRQYFGKRLPKFIDTVQALQIGRQTVTGK